MLLPLQKEVDALKREVEMNERRIEEWTGRAEAAEEEVKGLSEGEQSLQSRYKEVADILGCASYERRGFEVSAKVRELQAGNPCVTCNRVSHALCRPCIQPARGC